MLAKCKFRVWSKIVRTLIEASTFLYFKLGFFGEVRPNAKSKKGPPCFYKICCCCCRLGGCAVHFCVSVMCALFFCALSHWFTGQIACLVSTGCGKLSAFLPPN